MKKARAEKALPKNSPCKRVGSGRLVRQMPFVNNKGEVIHLPSNATIVDLLKLGITNFGLAPRGTPLPDGWFRDTETPTITLPNAGHEPRDCGKKLKP